MHILTSTTHDLHLLISNLFENDALLDAHIHKRIASYIFEPF